MVRGVKCGSCAALLLSLVAPLSSGSVLEFPLDVIVFDKPYEITAYLDDENETYWALSGDELIEVLAQSLDSTRLESLRSQFADSEITNKQLTALGWQVQYLPDELRIIIAIPVEEKQIIDLPMTMRGSHVPPQGIEHVTPNLFSGVINTSLSHSRNLVDTEYQSTLMTLKGAIALGDFTLEDQHSYSYRHWDGQGQWYRNQTRLTYDLPDDFGLFQLGDYQTQTSISTLPGGDLFGLSYSYQPRYLNSFNRPNSVPLTLESASLVTVRINGEDYRVLRLAAGQYNIRDLPLEQGVNEVEVVYVDQSGVEQRRFFNVVDSPDLILQGDLETQWVVGVVQDYDDDGFKYLDRDKPGAQAIMSYGVTDWWTSAPQVEWREERKKFMLSNNFALSDYFISIDGYYLEESDVYSHQGNISFYADTLLADSLESVNVNYELNDSSAAEHLTHTVSLSSGVRTPLQNGYLSFVLSNAFENSESVKQTASINTSYRWFDRLSTSLNFRWERAYGEDNHSVYFSMSLPLNWNNVSVYSRSSYDTRTDVNKNELTASQFQTDYYWRTSARFNDTDYEGFDGYGKIYGDRVDWNARYSTSNENTDSKNRTLTVGAETAVAWAGSEVVWTSPVSGSFTIVSLPEEFQDTYALKTDRYGRMKIVPKEEGEGSYKLVEGANRSYKTINVDGSELDFNEELMVSKFASISHRRSGTAYELSISRGYFVSGQFYDRNEQPIVDLVGEFQKENSSQTYPFFTGEDGSFELDILPPGHYRVYFYDGAAQEMIVQVREDQVVDGTFIDLGPLQVNTN